MQKSQCKLFQKQYLLLRAAKGFTLMELIVVIIILGVMSVGIAGFITLTTQTYLNVSERDELLANARFVVERLNREIRNAVPNSVRVANGLGWHCVEFVPIAGSTTYIDIPVVPETASNDLLVIPFLDKNGNDYGCGVNSTCRDLVTVYPLNTTDIYKNVYTTEQNTGKIFGLNNITEVTLNSWQLTVNSTAGIQFDEHSPTERLYVLQDPVSYCAHDTRGLWRFDNYIVTESQKTPPRVADRSLMAEHLAEFDNLDPIFKFEEATLQRSAIVSIKLNFVRDDESIVFQNEIHVKNIP